MKAKSKRKKSAETRDVAEVLPRPDVTDEELVEKILALRGQPSYVASAFGMSLADLLVRAKASASVKGAFAEAQQAITDSLRMKALSIAAGDERRGIDPDAKMIQWYLDKYGV